MVKEVESFGKSSLGMIHFPSESYSPILAGVGGAFGGANHGFPHHPDEEQNGAGVELYTGSSSRLFI